MAFNKVKLSEIIKDFIITLDGDDYASNASDTAIRNFALRGIREIGFDLGKKVKSLKSTVQSNNTITLPEDFVDLIKIGIVDSEGILRVFGENKNINYSRKITTPTSFQSSNEGPLNINDNLIRDREDDKTATDNSGGSDNDFGQYVFENYIYQGGVGRLYGAGGGHLAGEYRLNLDQDRIEIETNSDITDVVIEYVADEARSTDPEVHVYAEEALRSYIYYKIVERKSSVPANEKARARAEFYNERRKANARLSNFTKDEALKTIRKNFMQAPKY
mgnify:CR=1 FL=1|jgi:hypothetical protein|tara:strand:+ start:1833 stop:2660 length:828 start_codon:yes stop_codon:yes gene_type:complete